MKKSFYTINFLFLIFSLFLICLETTILTISSSGNQLAAEIDASLGGEINPSLVNLSYLNHLDLSFNSFHGTIPRSIGFLTQLRHLRLSHNWLHEIIPPETGVTNL
ncbi:hypothetical protein OSB04_017416 [Centaurea solstitialis]|uniref:Non-specific serine/threonine protein kinase n=1 Tax=Centaurea solstitialis TaxID=347529 RepID=A0AA38WM04_9ASTR|nr:hypothetical protein OSB04_017416 [Centaurea solstitialis]